MPEPPRFSEGARQAVHITMGAVALVLRFATWWEAAILAGVAVAINAHVLHRIPGWSLHRESEKGHRYVSGVTLYPVAILVLILVLRARLDIVAAAWGILAFGDGAATIAGRRVRSPAIPWNPSKSLAGSAAFVVFGGAAGALLCVWCRPPIVPAPYMWFSVAAPLVAAIAAAAVETIPVKPRRQRVGACHGSGRSLVGVALQRGLGRRIRVNPCRPSSAWHSWSMRSSRSPDTCSAR